MRRPGFTFLELMLTVAIGGAATAIAVPKLDDLKRRETASQVLQDVDAIKNAVYRFYSDSGYFPKEAPAAVIPENMDQYLPSGYSFTRKDWTIDYEHWTSTMPSAHVKTGIQVGVSVTIRDPKLGATVMNMNSSNSKFAVGSKYTFMIVGL